MPRDNSFASNPVPTIKNFRPGGNDFGVIRTLDGHNGYELGIEGANISVTGAGDPCWHDPISEYEMADEE